MKNHKRTSKPIRLASTCARVAAAALIFLFFLPFALSARQMVHRQIPAAAARIAPLRHMPGTNQFHLSISLPLRDKAGLENLLADLYDPASPNFHQFWTPEQFANRFGPTENDYQALIDFAKTNGLTITAKHPNRVLLGVSGSAELIEKAFHVTLNCYQHPDERREYYAPDADPSMDIDISVLGVGGLDNFYLPHPRKLKKIPFAEKPLFSPQVGSAPGGYLMGNDFRAAYVPGSSLTGAGQTVGLLQFDGYYTNDIAQYRALAGLPNIPLQNVLIDGATGNPGSANSEVALDIGMVMSMAPGLSKIIVYEAPNNSSFFIDILNRMITDNLAKQLSCSWGGGPPSAAAEQAFQQMAAQGQSFFNASGDSDAFSGSVPFPSESPNITQVGGTTLNMSGNGSSWSSEITWNWYNDGSGTNGTCGGISTTYPIPAWQRGIDMASNQGSTTMRNIPDVSMAADNIYLFADNGIAYIMAGTSAAAPLWAGFTALLNQQSLAGGGSTMGLLNPALYALGKSTNASSYFHDITTGNNTNTASPNLFFAVPGYDLCTGWGTPRVGLINALVPPISISGYTVLAESCTPTNGAIDPGETVTINLTLRNTTAASTTNLTATLLSSTNILLPSGPQVYGAIAGVGGTASKPFSFTAVGTCAQTITLALHIQDGSNDLGTVTYSFVLGQLVTGIIFSENFDSVTAPALPSGWTSTASGAQSPWVTSGSAKDTSPNAAFTAGANNVGDNALVSPGIPIYSSAAQLSFRHNFNFQTGGFSARDGGVLEIKFGSSPFFDIITGGGSFVTGAYNNTISTSRSNPLGGRQAWSGSSSGFVTTTVNLPASAAGQTIQLKWRCGTDNSTASTGWYVDSVAVVDTYSVCGSDTADLAVSQTITTSIPQANQSFTYTITVTNSGPCLAAGVTLTNVLPAGATFVSASPGCVYSSGKITCALGTLPAGAYSNVIITVRSPAGNVTNAASVASVTPDVILTNNNSLLVSLVAPNPPYSVTPLFGTPFSCSLTSLLGFSYSLEYKNHLLDSNWTRLLPPVNGTGGLIFLSDTNTPQLTRFYRVRYD